MCVCEWVGYVCVSVSVDELSKCVCMSVDGEGMFMCVCFWMGWVCVWMFVDGLGTFLFVCVGVCVCGWVWYVCVCVNGLGRYVCVNGLSMCV